MKLHIQHLTKYQYGEKVPLNPHQLFLIPQQRTYFKIKKANWNISPEPVGKNERINAEGNPFFQVAFNIETDVLEVNVDLEIETFDFNPFSFILSPNIPYPFDSFEYHGNTGEFLRIYQKAASEPELTAFGLSIMSQSADIVTFLVNLLDKIHQNWIHGLRFEPGLLTPMETFSSKEGSCRDLSWMLMALLRNLGMATRFVSGYAYNPELDAGHELHGWIEVYLPGAGWVGLDPSLGLFTDHNYIPLASSFHPSHTLPISGTYGGLAASSFTSEVWIKEIS
ncbi:transglutaminase domain-containing protein [Aquiflexum sp.]|uniref:transglutaminase family protein n=1 Tax=Aquiflexum sp. TaxID=1872584 RepID=UPI003593AFD9